MSNLIIQDLVEYWFRYKEKLGIKNEVVYGIYTVT